MQGKTIVFDTITVKREGGIAFDVWHQNHYVPSVLATGQMLNVQCYGSPLRAMYVSVFESNASPAVLHGALPVPAHDAIISNEHQVAGFMNQQIAPGAGDPFRDAPILYPVLFNVPAEGEMDFNAWYDEEHLGILLKSPHWPLCRRFKVHNPAPLLRCKCSLVPEGEGFFTLTHEPPRRAGSLTLPSPPGRRARDEGRDATFTASIRDARVVASLPPEEGPGRA